MLIALQYNQLASVAPADVTAVSITVKLKLRIQFALSLCKEHAVIIAIINTCWNE